MLARCARCQGTFTTDRYGQQPCPLCGSELILADPGGPQPPPAPPPDAGPGWGAAPPWTPEAGTPPPGSPPPPAGGGGWAPPPPPPPASPGGDTPSPFADPGGRGYLWAIVETWKLVCLAPQRFFARVRTDQLGPAILFGLIAASVGGFVASFFGILYNAARATQLAESLEKMPPQFRELLEKLFRLLPFASPNADPWTAIPYQLVFVLVNYFVGMLLLTLVIHLFLLMFKGAGRGFGATLTVVAYSFAAQAVQAAGGPFLGSYVALIWQVVVLVIGLAAVHHTDVWRALLAVLLPGVLCCCCVVCGAAIAGASLVGALSGGGGVTNL